MRHYNEDGDRGAVRALFGDVRHLAAAHMLSPHQMGVVMQACGGRSDAMLRLADTAGVDRADFVAALNEVGRCRLTL